MRKLYGITYILMAFAYSALYVEIIHTNVAGRGDLGWSLLYGFTLRAICKWTGVFVCRLFGFDTKELE